MNWIEDNSALVESAASAHGRFDVSSLRLNRHPISLPASVALVGISAYSNGHVPRIALPLSCFFVSSVDITEAKSTKDTKGHERGAGDSQECESRVGIGLAAVASYPPTLGGLYRNPQNLNDKLTSGLTDIRNRDDKLTSALTDIRNLDDKLTSVLTNIRNLDDKLTSGLTNIRNLNDKLTSALTDIRNLNDKLTSGLTDIRNCDDKLTSGLTDIRNPDDKLTSAPADTLSTPARVGDTFP